MRQFLLELVEKSIRLAPPLMVFKLHKGALLYESHDREEAWKLFQQASTGTDRDVRALTKFYLALVERKRGHLKYALRLARSVLHDCHERWILKRLRLEFGLGV
jgi:hypothetical protein